MLRGVLISFLSTVESLRGGRGQLKSLGPQTVLRWEAVGLSTGNDTRQGQGTGQDGTSFNAESGLGHTPQSHIWRDGNHPSISHPPPPLCLTHPASQPAHPSTAHDRSPLE
ncbi:hypothetical protein BD289DRAFT_71907 [Coniella lustricola]|uniref:Uncharacterized protein n=1 Tax=Coniella lustricola TaxID=2025994 RepID=A0A2T2ZZQ4_9PEZI|nr:hypothetical protein BD289DRAFT_71907 [Coniella lustricola]